MGLESATSTWMVPVAMGLNALGFEGLGVHGAIMPERLRAGCRPRHTILVMNPVALPSTLVGPPLCSAFRAILSTQEATIREEIRAEWPDHGFCEVAE